MGDKENQYIADTRQWVRDYQEMMKRAWKLQNDYGLYQGLLAEEGMPESIIPNPDRITSFTDAFANLQSIFASFDAGIDTNFERIS